MNTKFKTTAVLIASTLVSLLFLIYGFMQKQEADAQREIAEQARMQAGQARMEADQQRVLAIHNEQKAREQELQALEALEACRKLRK